MNRKALIDNNFVNMKSSLMCHKLNVSIKFVLFLGTYQCDFCYLFIPTITIRKITKHLNKKQLGEIWLPVLHDVGWMFRQSLLFLLDTVGYISNGIARIQKTITTLVRIYFICVISM